MNLASIGKTLCKRLLIGLVTVVCLNAIDRAINGEDILGREPDPTKTRVDRDGFVHLGTDDYTVV